MSESPHPIERYRFIVNQNKLLRDDENGTVVFYRDHLARLQEVEGENKRLELALAAEQKVTQQLEAENGLVASVRAESAETRLREAAADFERRRNAAYELVDANRAAEFQRGAAYAFEFAAEALRTDPNPTEPMASGAAEKNSQGTSDSEDKAVPGLATEGDE